MRYREEVDGLRAIAVLGVLFNHVKLFPLTGGYLGVDIFFVISGYLISSLLFEEIDKTGTISLSAFYQRRVRRILPALFVCLAVCFVPFSLLLSGSPAFLNFSHSLLSVIFSASNIYFWQHSGYFAPAAVLTPLLHTWTLGVEEQFYLVIPVLLFWLTRTGDAVRRRRWIVIAALAVLSFVLCRYGRNALGAEFTFYMLPTRMWELLLGVLTALVLRRFSPGEGKAWRLVRDIVSLACVAAMCLIFYYQRESTHIAESALMVTACTAALLFCCTGTTRVGRLLSLGPVRLVGKISYSLYLWHWPLVCLSYVLGIKYGIAPSVATKSAVLAASLVLAYLSWRYVESPFRVRRKWSECRPLAVLFAALLAAGCAGALLSAGHKDEYVIDKHFPPVFCGIDKVRKGEFAHLGPAGSPARYILIGDSHAQFISAAMEALSLEYGVAGEAGFWPGVLPLADIQRETAKDGFPYAQAWIDHIERNNIGDVLVVCQWNAVYTAPFIDSRRHIISAEEARRRMLEGLRAFIGKLTAQGREVWLLDQVPSFKIDPVIACRLIDPAYAEAQPSQRGSLLRELFADLDNPRAHLLDAGDVLAPGGMLRPLAGKSFLYSDDNHLTRDGSLLVRDVFRPMFERMRP
jgi:peptidoglycan/LPS O-acetylase OafA/YrhL